MSRTREEQETIIGWDRSSSEAWVWTAATAVRNRLRKRGFVMEPYGGGWRGTLPQKAISFRSRDAVFRPRKPRAYHEEPEP